MRIGFSVVTIILASSLLVGCNTVSEGQYKTVQTILSTDARVKQDAVKNCVAGQQRLSIADRSANAAIMNVSVSNYPKVFCKRFTNAMANGRITYADYKSVISGTPDYRKFIHIMQGK
jgi:hypothetical protein